jgi:hypothetical protein
MWGCTGRMVRRVRRCGAEKLSGSTGFYSCLQMKRMTITRGKRRTGPETGNEEEFITKPPKRFQAPQDAI